MSLYSKRVHEMGWRAPFSNVRSSLPGGRLLAGAPSTPNGSRIQYRDGEVSLASEAEGFAVILNGQELYSSLIQQNTSVSPSYATGFRYSNGARMAIIRTMEDGLYGIGRGVIVGAAHGDAPRVAELPDQPIQVTIEQPCQLPGFERTTNVQAVHFRIEQARPGSGGSFGFARQIDGGSPFRPLDRLLLSGAAMLDPSLVEQHQDQAALV